MSVSTGSASATKQIDRRRAVQADGIVRQLRRKLLVRIEQQQIDVDPCAGKLLSRAG